MFDSVGFSRKWLNLFLMEVPHLSPLTSIHNNRVIVVGHHSDANQCDRCKQRKKERGSLRAGQEGREIERYLLVADRSSKFTL